MTNVRRHYRRTMKGRVAPVREHVRRDLRQERAVREYHRTPIEAQYVRGVWFVKVAGGWHRVEQLPEDATVRDVETRFEAPIVVTGAIGRNAADHKRALGG